MDCNLTLLTLFAFDLNQFKWSFSKNCGVPISSVKMEALSRGPQGPPSHRAFLLNQNLRFETWIKTMIHSTGTISSNRWLTRVLNFEISSNCNKYLIQTNQAFGSLIMFGIFFTSVKRASVSKHLLAPVDNKYFAHLVLHGYKFN